MPETTAEKQVRRYDDKLPVEVLAKILSYLRMSDKKEAARVCRLWYTAYQCPVVQQNVAITLHQRHVQSRLSQYASYYSVPNLRLRFFADWHGTAARMLQTSWLHHLQSLVLCNCNINKPEFVTLLQNCSRLQFLELTSCDYIFSQFTDKLNKVQCAFTEEELNSMLPNTKNIRRLRLESLYALFNEVLDQMIWLMPNLSSIEFIMCPVTIAKHDKKTNDLPVTAFIYESMRHCARLKSLEICCAMELDDNDLIKLAQIDNLKLERISITDCHGITDDGIEALVDIQTDLKYVNFSRCRKITSKGLLAILRRLQQIKALNICSCNEIKDESVLPLVDSSTLQHLNIANLNTVSIDCLEKVFSSKMTSLTVLILSSLPRFTTFNSLVEVIASNLNQLEHLEISRSAVDDHGLIAICNGLTNLQYLSLENNRDITDDGLFGLIGAQRQLFISDLFPVDTRNMQSKDILGIRRLKKLLTLKLAGCVHISSICMSNMLRFSGLCHLDLTGCTLITDESLLEIVKNNPTLEELSIGHAYQITDDGLINAVGRLRRLKRLDVPYCERLTDRAISGILEHCRSLRFFDMHFCERITEIGRRYLRERQHLEYSL